MSDLDVTTLPKFLGKGQKMKKCNDDDADDMKTPKAMPPKGGKEGGVAKEHHAAFGKYQHHSAHKNHKHKGK